MKGRDRTGQWGRSRPWRSKDGRREDQYRMEKEKQRGCKGPDGTRGSGALVAGRRDGTALGRDPAPGPGAGKWRGGGRAGGAGTAAAARVGAGAGARRRAGARVTARREGGREGRGLGPRRRILHPPRGGCAGGGAPAAVADRRTDRPTAEREQTDGGPHRGHCEPEPTRADDARPQAPRRRVLPRGLTTAGRRPSTGQRSPHRAEVSARPVRPHPRGLSASPTAAAAAEPGALFCAETMGEGGPGPAGEGEREREHGGRAGGSLCAGVIEWECVAVLECARGVGSEGWAVCVQRV